MENDSDGCFENNHDEASEDEASNENKQKVQIDLDTIDVKSPVLAKFKFTTETIDISTE